VRAGGVDLAGQDLDDGFAKPAAGGAGVVQEPTGQPDGVPDRTERR
jgi:hypothetical protein